MIFNVRLALRTIEMHLDLMILDRLNLAKFASGTSLIASKPKRSASVRSWHFIIFGVVC